MRTTKAKYAGICADSACGRPYEVGHKIARAWVCTHLEHPAAPERGTGPSPTVAEPEDQAAALRKVHQATPDPVLIVRPAEHIWGGGASRAAKAALLRCGIKCRTRMGRGTVAGKLDIWVAPWPGEPQPDPNRTHEVYQRPAGWWDWNQEQNKWLSFVNLIASTACGGGHRSDSGPGCDYQPLDDVSVHTDDAIDQSFALVRWDVEGLSVPWRDNGTGEKGTTTWNAEDRPEWPIN